MQESAKLFYAGASPVRNSNSGQWHSWLAHSPDKTEVDGSNPSCPTILCTVRVMNKISKKYLKMSEVYCIFSSPWKNVLDFSENALVDMYHYETFGEKMKHPNANGFYVGKQWMDVMIVMWREDIKKSLLTKHELYEDGSFPRWWLDKVLV